MRKTTRRGFGQLCAAAALAVGFGLTQGSAALAQAEDYPSKPVRIIVPVAPGGPMDMIARLMGEKLSEEWGQPFLIENRPGGGQVIGTNEVVTSLADGYTLALMSHVWTMNPWLFDDLPYEQDALTPVTRLTITPLIMAVNPALPFEDVQDVIDYAEENPGELTFGSSGPSSSLRFAGELLKFRAGIDMLHIPYKGNGPMTVALAAGEIDVGFVNPVSKPFIDDGQIRALAITSIDRAESMPDLPTIAESGIEGYEAGSWFGLMAPAGTPPEIIDKLNAGLNEALGTSDVLEKLAAVEARASGTTVSEMEALITAEREKWRELIETTGVTVQ